MPEKPLKPLTDEQIHDQLGAAAPVTDNPGLSEEPAPARPRGARPPRARKPRERAPRKPGTTSTRPRKPALGPRVAELHVLVGMGMSFAPGLPGNVKSAGVAMAGNAESIGAAWEAMAKENPRVRETLEKLLTVGAAGQLLMAYLPVVLAATGKAGDLAAIGGLAAMMSEAPAPGPDLHVVPGGAATVE